MLIICFLLLLNIHMAYAQDAMLIRTYDAPEANQAVAVDRDHFYAIGNSVIGKYRKSDGKKIDEWRDNEIIKHLNSGIVLDGLLYCTNSNFPDSPMASSIEVFDTGNMKHQSSRSLGIYEGSLTWILRQDDAWWMGFAHYSEGGSSEGKDNHWTSVLRFDNDWQRQEGWIFPPKLIEKFSPSSNSGAAWGPNGNLHCTGHDAQEVYVMQVPDRGYTLQHIKTIPVPFEGQGIAWDFEENLLYGISRKNRQVLVISIP